MPRILFDARVTTETFPSGVNLFASQWLTALSAHRESMEIVLFDNRFRRASVTPDQTQTQPFPVIRTRYPNQLLSLAWTLSTFPKLKQLSGFDLIHSPHINVIRHGRTRRLVSMPDLTWIKFPSHTSIKDRLWHRLMARSARQADHFTANSHTTKQELIDTWNIEAERITVVYPGAPPCAPHVLPFAQSPWNRLLSAQRYFVFIGNLVPRKNLANLLHAFAQTQKNKELTGFKLVIIGRGHRTRQSLLKVIEKNKLQQHVLLTDYLDDADKQTILNNALALVFPSLYEGFGLPLLEAMQAQIPILTSPCGALPEVAGQAAWYADPYDPQIIAEGMQRLAQDDALRTTLIEAGQKQLQCFSWERTAATTLTLYQTLTS